MNKTELQVLRTVDKLDRIGLDGVIATLQKPSEEFGAALDPLTAAQIGCFLDLSPNSAERFNLIKNRKAMLITLESGAPNEDGLTPFDVLLDMPENEDQTWRDGGRPKNIAWALDDLFEHATKAAAV